MVSNQLVYGRLSRYGVRPEGCLDVISDRKGLGYGVRLEGCFRYGVRPASLQVSESDPLGHFQQPFGQFVHAFNFFVFFFSCFQINR